MPLSTGIHDTSDYFYHVFKFTDEEDFEKFLSSFYSFTEKYFGELFLEIFKSKDFSEGLYEEQEDQTLKTKFDSLVERGELERAWGFMIQNPKNVTGDLEAFASCYLLVKYQTCILVAEKSEESASPVEKTYYIRSTLVHLYEQFFRFHFRLLCGEGTGFLPKHVKQAFQVYCLEAEDSKNSYNYVKSTLLHNNAFAYVHWLGEALRQALQNVELDVSFFYDDQVVKNKYKPYYVKWSTLDVSWMLSEDLQEWVKSKENHTKLKHDKELPKESFIVEMLFWSYFQEYAAKSKEDFKNKSKWPEYEKYLRGLNPKLTEAYEDFRSTIESEEKTPRLSSLLDINSRFKLGTVKPLKDAFLTKLLVLELWSLEGGESTRQLLLPESFEVLKYALHDSDLKTAYESYIKKIGKELYPFLRNEKLKIVVDSQVKKNLQAVENYVKNNG